ncbi:MAG: hypothetical protein IPG67_17190 [Acidobacteria bacterium]|nr:hypothetical protein [Acidobacteriota bacterium]
MCHLNAAKRSAWARSAPACGQSILSEFNNIPNVRVTALCDVLPEKQQQTKAKAIVEKAGQPSPTVYVNGDRGHRTAPSFDDRRVCVATPWEWHVSQSLDA